MTKSIAGLDLLSAGKVEDKLFYANVSRALAALGIVAVAPFAIFHLYYGEEVIGGIASTVVAAQAALFVLLRNPRYGVAGTHILAAFHSSGAVLATLQMGIAASYWTFPTTVANYYILPLRSALLVNGATLVAVTPALSYDMNMGLRFLVALSLVNMFGYIFSRRSETHQMVLKELLYQDDLTGVGNRRAMDQEIEAVMELYRRDGMPVSLMILDLDHFKQVNDQYGHQAGDKVLGGIVTAVQHRLRINDRLFRFGGEEFVIVTRNTMAEGARVLAEDLRRAAGQVTVVPTDGVTVSIGVAELQEGENPDDWLRRADKALFEAKRAGRDCVMVSAC